MKTINILTQLRALAILEGISYLLLFPTMVLKYKFEMGMPNKIVGGIHGILFVLYCIWVIYYAILRKWNISKSLISLAASLFPFATFIVDHKILKPESLELKSVKVRV